MANKITNTAVAAKENPAATLGEHLAMGSPAAIEASEARGQAELCASTVLPREVLYAPREHLERLGIKFGADVPGDPLFVEATLPPGWSRKAADHSMWSYLVDEHGRHRVSVFYKAAFYDRRAHMMPVPRFASERLEGRCVVRDNALVKVVHDGGDSDTHNGLPAYRSCIAFIEAQPDADSLEWPNP